MSQLLEQMEQRIRGLVQDWPKYTLIGSFILYLFGYLAVRFHLTTMGVATDLALVDERYVFAGARFFIYLVAELLIIVFIGLLPWVLGVGVCRALSPARREAICNRPLPPWPLVLIGIVFATLAIQLLMRQCFQLNDLLLADKPPPHISFLVAQFFEGPLGDTFFNILLVSCLLTLAILVSLSQLDLPPGLRRARMLLGLLAAVQVLLLPVNYGVLVMDKSLARVTAVGTKELNSGETAWLVWQGNTANTYLLRSADTRRRSLIAEPNTPPYRIEVLAIEPIIPEICKPSIVTCLFPEENPQ